MALRGLRHLGLARPADLTVAEVVDPGAALALGEALTAAIDPDALLKPSVDLVRVTEVGIDIPGVEAHDPAAAAATTTG